MVGKTKKRMYFGLLIAVGGAFILDRTFHGQPASAPAETSSCPPKAAKLPKPEPPDAAEPAETADRSLTWLEQLGEQRSARDAFAPSAGMLMHYEKLRRVAELEEQQQGPTPGSPEAFQAEHELQGTFVSREAMLAVVDGRLLRSGDTIDGFRLAKVEPYRAEFRRGRHRVTLSIPLPAATK